MALARSRRLSQRLRIAPEFAFRSRDSKSAASSAAAWPASLARRAFGLASVGAAKVGFGGATVCGARVARPTKNPPATPNAMATITRTKTREVIDDWIEV